MSSAELKIDARRKKILEYLNRDGKVVVSQLSKELGATPVTIRTDLDSLERDGFLERIQGGAIPKVNNFYELNYNSRLNVNSEVKKRIAEAAAKYINDGSTLFINSGTTTYYTAIALKHHKNLSIVTNSLAIAMELGHIPSFRIILLGGEINAQYGFVCGGDAQQQLSRYRADYAILSLDGVSAAGGITTYHADEAIIDQMMVEQSKKLIVVADHSKMGHEGFSLICNLDKVDIIVTDKASNSEVIKEITKEGVEVSFG